MMPVSRSLERSILIQGIVSLCAQALFLAVVFAAFQMSLSSLLLYLAIALVYHALLIAFLLSRGADFRLEGAQQPLERVNLSNTLTLARLSSIPTLLFLIIEASTYPLVPVLLPFACLVFATDFLDGIVARRRNQVTFVGRYLDSTSDYVMIIAVSIIFLHYQLIPAWFFILILARLILFALGMGLLALREGKADPVATFLGKASIFATMVLYVLELAERFGVPGIGNSLVVFIVEWVVAAIIVASVVDKAVFLGRRFAKAPPRRSGRVKGIS
ncbi:MAG TPA: CDP-alcohol phosphatidyltransferase family protein [Spirochaetia bacterium]|nr:CDP-alcohol phosphatidyltransferase family protein [Spirochaetia bacterium]